MSLDDVICFPSSLTAAATPPRSGVPSANNCSCCMMISPPKPPHSLPTPSHQLPLPILPDPTVYAEPRGARTFKLAFWHVAWTPLLAHFPRRPHQTTGHRKKSTLTMDKGAGTQQEPQPWVLCIGSPGPTDQRWLESQLPTSTSSPAPAPAGELWQPLPREQQSCCALTSERG